MTAIPAFAGFLDLVNVEDADFDQIAESSPWQAIGGELTDMLCQRNDCRCTSSNTSGFLRFPARLSGEVVAVQQSLILPEANRYRIRLWLLKCISEGNDTLSVSLGQAAAKNPSTPRGLDYWVPFLDFDAAEVLGESPVGSPVLLTIASSSQGGSVVLDGLSLYALPTDGEGENAVCERAHGDGATDLSGWWHGLSEWYFDESGNFENLQSYGEGFSSYSGSYAVDTSVIPHRIALHYTLVSSFGGEEPEAEQEQPPGSDIQLSSCRQGVYWICGNSMRLRLLDATGYVGETGEIFSSVSNLSPSDACPESYNGEPVVAAIEAFDGIDLNADSQLNANESSLGSITEALFAALDQNMDDRLSPVELLIAAGSDSPRHSADSNLDQAVSLGELLRVIQFYNAGGYSCAPLAESEDGYLPQPFGSAGVDPGCPAHASDYNPADGLIGLSELLRTIQLFNSGPYERCAEGGEDGFCGVG